jgi:hypothetical protein
MERRADQGWTINTISKTGNKKKEVHTCQSNSSGTTGGRPKDKPPTVSPTGQDQHRCGNQPKLNKKITGNNLKTTSHISNT